MKILMIGLLGILLVLLPSNDCAAFILINEFLADPSSVDLHGDANNDGTYSSGQDEFIELLNFQDAPQDISAWTLSDNLKIRHVFEDGTFLAPYSYLVVFGGGTLNLSGVNAFVASTGSLGLNNSADSIILKNYLDEIIDEVTYGSEGGKDQSLVLYPEGEGSFFLHSSVSASGDLFSPGKSLEGKLVLIEPQEVLPETDNPAAVPEVGTFLSLGAGLLWLRKRKNKSKSKSKRGQSPKRDRADR